MKGILQRLAPPLLEPLVENDITGRVSLHTLTHQIPRSLAADGGVCLDAITINLKEHHDQR